jgi:hypothetical protein
MPLQLPNLDDHTYDDLVQEAKSLIPTYAPDWTNHNPSDPGITLIELFAYLTEMLNYRLNRVTDANTEAFLKLINGPEWKRSSDKTLNEEIRQAVLTLRRPDRAVTCEDFESLVLQNPQVGRAKCVPERNLEFENRLHPETKPGHVSVVIVPKKDSNFPQHELIDSLKKDLEQRRLLTTRVHVVDPVYVQIGVHLTLNLMPDALEKDVHPRAVDALTKFLDPMVGGKEGKGWQFGRNVYVSEIYQLLDQLPGVDYVERMNNKDELTVINPQNTELGDGDTDRLSKNEHNRLIAVIVHPEELVALTKIEMNFPTPNS